jgi:hypothetical protein
MMPAPTLELGFCSCLYARCIGITITSTSSQNARVLCAPNLGGFDSFSRAALPCSLFVDKPILGFFQVYGSKRCPRKASGRSSESLSQYYGRDKGMLNGKSFNWANIATRNEWKPRDALQGKFNGFSSISHVRTLCSSQAEDIYPNP